MPIHSDENETELLSYSDTLKCLVKGMTLVEQLKSLPNIKVGKDSAKLIQEAKKRDREKRKSTFHASKICGILTCSACSAIRCVYSGKAPGADGGPSLIKLGRIQEKKIVTMFMAIYTVEINCSTHVRHFNAMIILKQHIVQPKMKKR